MGAKVLQKIHQKKQPNGVTIIERVEWDYTNVPQEDHKDEEDVSVIKGKSSPRKLLKRSRSQERSARNKSKILKEGEQAAYRIETDNKPINWTIVTVCSILIILLFLVAVNYLYSYQPNLELVLREEADQMTLVSLSIMLISLLFAIITFFH